jgi:glutathione S-transferase
VLQLHYIPGSAAMAPHAALAEAGTDYALALVERDEFGQRPPAYLALNPGDSCPRRRRRPGSDRGGGDPVAHRRPLSRSRARPAHRNESAFGGYRWLAYLTNTVQTSYLRWLYPERYTIDPKGAAAIRACEAATLRHHLDWLDNELSGRPWLAGAERTGADLFLFMLSRWGRLQEPPAWDRRNLRDHFRRLLECPHDLQTAVHDPRRAGASTGARAQTSLQIDTFVTVSKTVIRR